MYIATHLAIARIEHKSLMGSIDKVEKSSFSWLISLHVFPMKSTINSSS